MAIGPGPGTASAAAYVILVDALGTAPRRRLDASGLDDFDFVDDELWLVRDGVLWRHSLEEGALVGEPRRLLEPAESDDEQAQTLRPRLLRPPQGRSALLVGARWLRIENASGERLQVEDLGAWLAPELRSWRCVGALGEGRIALAQGGDLRIIDTGLGRRQAEEVGQMSLASPEQPVEVRACRALFAGRALAVWLAGERDGAVCIVRPRGVLVHRVAAPASRFWSVAESRGRAVFYAAPASALADGADSAEPDADAEDAAPDARAAAAQAPYGHLVSLDLRYGKEQGRVPAPMPVAALALDADARYVAVAGYPPPPLEDDEYDEYGSGARPAPPPPPYVPDPDAQPAIVHVTYAELLGGSRTSGRKRIGQVTDADQSDHLGRTLDARPDALPAAEDGDGSGATPEAAGDSAGDLEAAGQAEDQAEDARPVDAAAGVSPMAVVALASHPVHLPHAPLLGLGRARTLSAGGHGAVDARATDYLEARLDLVTAMAAAQVARAWDSGILSQDEGASYPGELMVHGLLGAKLGPGHRLAADAADEIYEQQRKTFARARSRLRAAEKARSPIPLQELGRDLELSARELSALLYVAAPALRGEIARLYRVLAPELRNAPCNEFLLERLLGGDDWAERRRVATSVAADSTLVRAGLVTRIPTDSVPGSRGGGAGLRVDAAVLARLRGVALRTSAPLYSATRPLEALWLPEEIKRELLEALAPAPRPGSVTRVVLRGRRGSGRRSLAAALAARVNRPLADIDCARMPQSGTLLAGALHTALCHAVIAGAIPCVSGLEAVGAATSEDREGIAHVRSVLRSHPGPVFVRTAEGALATLDPGYIEFAIPRLDETMRAAFWDEVIAQFGLAVDDPAALASRFRVGPGSIASAAETVAGRARPGEQGDGEAGPAGDEHGEALSDADALDLTLRQHIETRMSVAATRITRLATWSQVSMPDELAESVRELIARVRQRRTVFERWGFDRRLQSARGVSALFFGPPGVGKTMVAGLIARELGLDLYRVDLAQITSKWIGETEKNLAEIFEAGEDGQVVILFDEADSLFAKRTEVQSSVDRHANQQVNYLLTSLDSFEGVALLTTNREGAIDKAFKRRMTMRLAFPFPDEQMRARLWAAHIPSDIPKAGEFDLDGLAERFPLSGGYIRNCALRAAFLAAAEETPLTQEHLVRAVELEYKEMGKLAPSGRLE
ncbi:AAA ATPase central domain protein [Haliangium ochraceum DSM 14365]|uniref:AAA ATPase central domain protein n=1 Tax=Haliangium ochraceum (strain DSM 14365 / JCM 11303 / SMP-2) TaxID=502025 RepID=D0LFV2_HALO1|nr:AAA ATPase central domain protein [Haliangium ochraceum DSM 14365]